jgi:glycosyltransferase involved in cell wall biosynthesis
LTRRPARGGFATDDARSLKVLVLESFYGGSHRAVVEGLVRHSRHRLEVLRLPPNRWKWRLRTAAIHFAQRAAPRVAGFDVVLATGLLDLAHFRALVGRGCPSCLLYLHENQVSYPRPAGEPLDRGFAVAHLASLLAADRVAINSRFHRDELRRGLRDFLARVPEGRPRGVLRAVDRAVVLPPGVETADLVGDPHRPPSSRPVILWNHRREFDKQPEIFFRVMRHLEARGTDFALVLLGETTQALPRPFLAARERFRERILHDGYVPTRRSYASWLRRADIAVSTASQENFGIAAVEAMAAGAYPLLPRRLAYPEVLPRALHGEHLYRGVRDLEGRLRRVLREPARIVSGRPSRVRAALRYSWEELAGRYDRLLERTAGAAQPRAPDGRFRRRRASRRSPPAPESPA